MWLLTCNVVQLSTRALNIKNLDLVKEIEVPAEEEEEPVVRSCVLRHLGMVVVRRDELCVLLSLLWDRRRSRQTTRTPTSRRRPMRSCRLVLG